MYCLIESQAHPGVNDGERKKICGLMDCRKLTQEACSHAAQNERLPVQVVVQVLYFEQVRLKSAIRPQPEQSDHQLLQAGGGGNAGGAQLSQRITGGAALTISPRNDDQFAAVCRENRELKMEMARMRIQLGRPDDIVKVQLDQPPVLPLPDVSSHVNGHTNGQSHVNSHGNGHATQQTPINNNVSNKSSNKFLLSVSKTLNKLNPFQRPSKDSSQLTSSKSVETKSRRRRHSIS